MVLSEPFCETDRAVLKTLLYFELFAYPLTAEEVCRFSTSATLTPALAAQHLYQLQQKGLVFKLEEFYALQNRPDWAVRRVECGRRADALLPKAYSRALLIGQFPFVRAVLVSGSLSKHCISEHSDIDFFVITAPGRLWLARLLLVLFKKIFLFNSHKYFCVNYFLDTAHLEIEEKNIFTAIETATLLPVFCKSGYQQFYAANEKWLRQILPHVADRSLKKVPESPPFPKIKKCTEWLLDGRLGEWLDIKAMQLTVFFWKKKFRHYDPATFELAFKSRRYVSKHHPQSFQQQVLQALQERWQALELRLLQSE